jgi:hypothetical protein
VAAYTINNIWKFPNRYNSRHFIDYNLLIVDNDHQYKHFNLLNLLSYNLTDFVDGFGGLVVRMLASGSQVSGFKPGRSRWIFLYIKILSMPSFGGEVE